MNEDKENMKYRRAKEGHIDLHELLNTNEINQNYTLRSFRRTFQEYNNQPFLWYNSYTTPRSIENPNSL